MSLREPSDYDLSKSAKIKRLKNPWRIASVFYDA